MRNQIQEKVFDGEFSQIMVVISPNFKGFRFFVDESVYFESCKNPFETSLYGELNNSGQYEIDQIAQRFID